MAYDQLRRWPEAIADTSEAIALKPQEWRLWSARARAEAASDAADKARSDYAKAIELGANQSRVWYELALLHLANYDEQQYRSICKRVLTYFDPTDDPDTANEVAWSCALAPRSAANWAQPVRLAERAVAAATDLHTRRFYLNTLGAVYYRAGNFEAAVRRLTEAIELQTSQLVSPADPPDSSPRQTARTQVAEGTPWHWLFLVMAHHRLGHAGDARRWLGKAMKSIDQDPQASWSQRLELEILRKEAQALMNEKGH